MPESNSAFGQIVGGKFEGNFVTRQNADAIPAKPAGEVRKHYAFMFQLNAEQAAGKFLEHGARYFNAVFLTHSTSFRSSLFRVFQAGAEPFALPRPKNKINRL
jgi:hypothetical protein